MPRRWLDELRILAVGEGVALIAAGLPQLDREPLALGIVFIAVAWLLRYKGGVPAAIVLALLFIDVIFFTATAAISNLSGGTLTSILLPGSLAILSLLGVIAAAGAIAARQYQFGWTGFRALAFACGILVLVATAGSVFRNQSVSLALGTGGDILLRMHNATYSATRLSASGSSVRIDIHNDDLFWHSFTIDSLKVDVLVPVQGHSGVSFTAAPGTYTFYCRIPGHRQAGMVGTLTVP